MHGFVGAFHHFLNAGEAAVFVEIFWGGILGLRVFLKHQSKKTVSGQNVVDQLSAFGGFNQQRSNHAREDDDV